MSDILLFATAVNTRIRKWVSGKQRFKKDGDEFVREMYKFEHHLELCQDNVTAYECYDRSYPKKRDLFVPLLRQTKPSTIALFCHGSKKWIYGIGYHRWNLTQLAREIKRTELKTTLTIILYACSCGKGTGNIYPIGKVSGKAGIAMMLANELAELDVKFKIIAHTTKGHADKNPNCVIITKELDQIFKQFIVPRVTWWKRKKDPIGRKRWLKWCKMLHEHTYFRFEFPFMTIDQIHTALDDVS